MLLTTGDLELGISKWWDFQVQNFMAKDSKILLVGILTFLF